MEIEEIPFSHLLSEVIDNRGRTCPTEETGIPLIATNCIRNDRLYPTHEKVRFVSQHTYSNWFRGHPKPGDILFVNKATPGRVCFVPDPINFCIAQDMVAVRADPAVVYPKYLLAVLRSPVAQARIAQMNVGTLIPHFKKGDFDKLLLPVPSDEVQKFIGDSYFDLSAKVEVSRGISKTLEEIARALFKSWFVDFDPVRGTATVPVDIRRLFPDRLLDSAIGPIPEGWAVTPLGEQVEVTRGLSYSGAGLADEGMPMHNLNSVLEGGGYKYDGIKHYTGEFRERDRVRPHDVIVANTDLTQRSRVIGYPATVPCSFEEGLFSHHLYRVRAFDGSPLTSRWLYLLLVGSAMHARVAGYSNGTTVNMLPKEGLTKQRVALPSAELVARFDDIVRPMFDQQESLVIESRTLAELRDTLLPKLISGEVRLN